MAQRSRTTLANSKLRPLPELILRLCRSYVILSSFRFIFGLEVIYLLHDSLSITVAKEMF